jgi:TPR repeat protein
MMRGLAALAIFLVSSAMADINAGVEALGRFNYPNALEEFRPGAENGDWAAQSFLAYTYVQMENYREAYAWYHAAAECGSLDARIERTMLEGKMTPARIEQAKELGRDYYGKYCKPQ